MNSHSNRLETVPVPPKNVRILPVSDGKTHVMWDYDDPGFLFSKFIIQHRAKNCNQSCTMNAEKLDSCFQFGPGPAVEVRVAMDTCIGLSKFSSIVVVPEVRKQSRPVIKRVTESTADLEWTPQPNGADNRQFTYQIRCCRMNALSPPNIYKLDAGVETKFGIKQLQPKTTYTVNVVPNSGGQEKCMPSESIQFTTLKIRFAKKMVDGRCKIASRNDLDLYAVPMKKSTGCNSSFERYFFSGENDGNKNYPTTNGQHKTILLVGQAGSDKTTLINAMVNYIFDVSWEETFRFQLIEDQVNTSTSYVTIYDFQHAKGFRIPYSLTIVDVQRDAKHLNMDNQVNETIFNLLEDKNGIQEVDLICFLAGTLLPDTFSLLLSTLGKDVKQNICFLTTVGGDHVPLPLPCPEEIVEAYRHNFNSPCLFQLHHLGNVSFWMESKKNFQDFFKVLATTKTMSLSQTKQVLKERKQMETALDELQSLIITGLV